MPAHLLKLQFLALRTFLPSLRPPLPIVFSLGKISEIIRRAYLFFFTPPANDSIFKFVFRTLGCRDVFFLRTWFFFASLESSPPCRRGGIFLLGLVLWVHGRLCSRLRAPDPRALYVLSRAFPLHEMIRACASSLFYGKCPSPWRMRLSEETRLGARVIFFFPVGLLSP